MTGSLAQLFVCIRLQNQIASQIAGHNDNRVFKVHDASLPVRQTAVVEHLQKYVEYVGVRFFYFVEQYDAVRPPAYRFGKLSALVVTDIAGRRSDKAAYAEFFHVLAHVYAGKRFFVVKQKVGERFCKLGFADARRADKQKAS